MRLAGVLRDSGVDVSRAACRATAVAGGAGSVAAIGLVLLGVRVPDAALGGGLVAGAAFSLGGAGRPRSASDALARLGTVLLASAVGAGGAALAGRVGAGALVAVVVAAALGAVTLRVAVVLEPRAARIVPGGAGAGLRSLALATVALSVLARLVFLPVVELIPEESYYWSYATHLDIGYLDHPPMVAWLIRAGTALLGDTEAGVRLATVACWCATLAFATALTRRIAGAAAAAVTAVLVAATPFFVSVGFFAMPDAPLAACWAATVWFLHGALVLERRRAWWGVGVSLGLGLLSKYPIALLGAGVAVLLLLDRPARAWLRRPEPWGAVLLAAAIFSPVIVWNARHDWVSFAFQTVGRVEHSRHFNLPAFVVFVLVTATPTIVLAAWLGLRRPDARPGDPGVDPRSRRFCAALSLVPLAVFAIASIVAQTKMQWTGPCWLALLPLASAAAAGAVRGASSAAGRVLASCLRPTAIVVLALTAVAFHAQSSGLPWAGFPTSFGVGQRELGADVAAATREIAAREGTPPVVAGLDRNKISAALAFYDPERAADVPRASHNIVGREGLMYGLWTPAESVLGRTVILVTDDVVRLDDAHLQPWFAGLGPVVTLPVRRQGFAVSTWYLRVGHGYRGRPAPERGGALPGR